MTAETNRVEARVAALAGLRVEIDRQLVVRRRDLARLANVPTYWSARDRLLEEITDRAELRRRVVDEITRLEDVLHRFDRLAHGAPMRLDDLIAETARPSTTQEGHD